MAIKYIDNRLTTGANDGTSAANAWRSLYDARIGSKAAGDTINFVAGSGPYYEAVNQSAGLNVRATDISFDAATRRIRSTASTFASFTAGHIIRVMGSSLNDGQYTVLSVSGAGPFDLIVAASNALVNESAGATVRVINIQPASNTTVPMVFDPGGNGSSPSPITWEGNGCEISAGWVLTNSAMHAWTQSTRNSNEWYVRRADGTNPSLLNPQSATVNGNFICASAGDATHKRGTVGALTYEGQYGYGDVDSLGYSTVYVRSPGNPITLGWTIVVSQIQHGYYQNWTDHIYNNLVWSYGNGLANGSADGACVYGRGTRLKWRRCVFAYADGHGVEANTTGPFTFDHCIMYWSGHRAILHSGVVTANVYNCIGFGTHLFALATANTVSGSLANTGTLNLYGCISSNNEAGAVDIKGQTVAFSSSAGLLGTVVNDVANLQPIRFQSVGGTLPTGLTQGTVYYCIRVTATTFRIATTLANAVAATAIAFTDAGTGTMTVSAINLNEDYNCWYPRMTASGGALSYIDPGHWPTTGPRDIPPSTATTLASQALLTDPQFTTLSDTAFASCDFRLKDSSDCAGRGPWEIGDSFIDFAGNTYTGGLAGLARALNQGAYENAARGRPTVFGGRVST